MQYSLKARLALTAAIAVAAIPAHAATIPGLFSTGTDANNVALVGGDGVTDPHYTIFASTSPGFAGGQAVTYFNGAYSPDSAASRWISLSANGNPGLNTTTYRLSFDLSGFDPGSAQLSGRFASDNESEILLNGVVTGSTTGIFQLTNFSIDDGFVAGINVLDFRVTDTGPPTALRVEFLSSSIQPGGVIDPIPEPATWAMMIGGFGLAGTAMRRRRNDAVSAAWNRA